MQAMITNNRYGHSSTESSMVYEDYKFIGDLSLLQLTELRHRGAFSTVAQTFATCCIKCASLDDPQAAELPNVWYRVSLVYNNFLTSTLI